MSMLVDNIFIDVGNKTFRQLNGIPMGTDSVPLLTNFHNFMRGLK